MDTGPRRVSSHTPAEVIAQGGDTERVVILFDNAGVGRSTGKVPTTVAEMSSHALDFLDALAIDRCDVVG